MPLRPRGMAQDARNGQKRDLLGEDPRARTIILQRNTVPLASVMTPSMVAATTIGSIHVKSRPNRRICHRSIRVSKEGLLMVVLP